MPCGLFWRAGAGIDASRDERDPRRAPARVLLCSGSTSSTSGRAARPTCSRSRPSSLVAPSTATRYVARAPRLRPRGEPALRRGPAAGRAGAGPEPARTRGPCTPSRTCSTSGATTGRGVEILPPRDPSVRPPRLLPEPSPWHLALLHLAAGRLRARRAPLRERVRPLPDRRSPRTSRIRWRWPGGSTSSAGPTRGAGRTLGARRRGRWLDLPLLLFHDLHVGMALAASGDWAAAEEQLERLRAAREEVEERTLPEVVVPLLEGLHAFARGDYAGAVARIAPSWTRAWSRWAAATPSARCSTTPSSPPRCAPAASSRRRSARAPARQAPEPRALLDDGWARGSRATDYRRRARCSRR